MKEYKIPMRFQCSGIVRVRARNLSDACFKAQGCAFDEIPKEDVEFVNESISLVDERRLERLYPVEVRQMNEDAKPEWEKRGWKQDSTRSWHKGRARIVDGFDDVGWGFEGTVWIGNNGKSGFSSLESAMDWAEKNM